MTPLEIMKCSAAYASGYENTPVKVSIFFTIALFTERYGILGLIN